MKKYEFPNKDLKIEFIDTYNKEVTEKRKKEYESKIAKIPTTEGKLNFAEAELVKYNKNLSAESAELSGRSIAQGHQPEGAHLFFDKYIKADIEYLKQQLNKEKNTKPKKSVEKPEMPKRFEEIFYDVNLMQPCIDILKQVEPPLIDSDCNFIGKPKGAICVWIDEMQRQAIIKHVSDRKQLAILISDKIKNFSINDRMFDNHHSTAERQYRDDFKALISKYKISSKK